jgi:hypothetical protein
MLAPALLIVLSLAHVSAPETKRDKVQSNFNYEFKQNRLAFILHPPANSLLEPRPGKIEVVAVKDVLFEITHGSDDGVLPGDQFNIVRKGKIIGVLEAKHVEADRSAAKILEMKKDHKYFPGDEIIKRKAR